MKYSNLLDYIQQDDMFPRSDLQDSIQMPQYPRSEIKFKTQTSRNCELAFPLEYFIWDVTLTTTRVLRSTSKKGLQSTFLDTARTSKRTICPFNILSLDIWQGYCSISLMREKAIASTAIVEDGEFDLASRIQRPRSRASSYGCGLGGRVVYHARRLSKGNLYWRPNGGAVRVYGDLEEYS